MFVNAAGNELAASSWRYGSGLDRTRGGRATQRRDAKDLAAKRLLLTTGRPPTGSRTGDRRPQKKCERNRYKLHRNRNRLNGRAKRNEIVVHQSGPRLVLCWSSSSSSSRSYFCPGSWLKGKWQWKWKCKTGAIESEGQTGLDANGNGWKLKSKKVLLVGRGILI